MSVKTIAVIGGDRRIACMIPLLQEKGYRVISYGMQDCPSQKKIMPEELKETVKRADVIIGSIPLFRGESICPQVLLAALEGTENTGGERAGKILFGGVIEQSFKKRAEELGVCCFDFMEEEKIALFNTIATAEGAIAEAICHQETNLHGSRSLVLGYGRCAKVLAQKLKCLDVHVTVCCRSEIQQALAQAFGCEVLLPEKLDLEIESFEYIFNTIPQVILKEALLQKMSHSALIVDLASGKGGVEFEKAKELGVRALHCLGLPGIYAPKSSARIFAEFVLEKIKDQQD